MTILKPGEPLYPGKPKPGNSHRRERSESEILPWVRSLTRQRIAQLWFHHTGHDESHGYGSKAREWQMDTVAMMESVKDETRICASRSSSPKPGNAVLVTAQTSSRLLYR